MLTDTKIKAAMKAVATEHTLRDKADGRGAGSLLLVVRRLADKSATATWYATVKRHGKRAKKTLGRYPELSLADARALMRSEISPALRKGQVLQRATGVGTPTVGRMFEAYVAGMRAKGRASADEVERMLLTCDGNAADHIGRDRLAADVTPADCIAWIATFYERGFRGAADKARAYLSAAFGWALKSANDYTAKTRADWGIRANPVAAIPKDAGARRTRDRNLQAGEIAALWYAEGMSVETLACIRLLLCCGQRVQETLRIDGSEVDLDRALWRMPAEKTKGGKRPHTIPLPALAVDVLRQLKELHGDGPLFPARSGSKGDRMEHQTIGHALARWRARPDVDVPAFQPRDLRRTWKSRAHDAGVDRFTRDLIQQHAQGDTGSKHYDRATYLPQMRAAMDAWNEWLLNVVAGEPELQRAA